MKHMPFYTNSRFDKSNHIQSKTLIQRQTQRPIAPIRYFKIQLETKDITTRLRGINHINLLYH